MGDRAARQASREARQADRGDRRRRGRSVHAGGDRGDAASSPGGAAAGAGADRAAAGGRPRASSRHLRGGVDLPRAPQRARLRRCAGVSARALPRQPSGDLHLDPLRRRHPALHRRLLCDL